MFGNSFRFSSSFRGLRGIVLQGIATVFVLGWLAAAPAQAQTTIGPQRVVVAVRVTDENSGALLDQVKLELVQFPSVIMHAIFTDSSGRAEFPAVFPDEYTVRASKMGYQPSQAAVSPPRGQTRYDVSIELEAVRPNPAKPGGVISARELSIPEPAREEFDRGLRFLDLKKDPKQSIGHFEKAIASFPGYYEAYFLLGMAHLETASPQEAQTALRRSIDLNPGYLQPYYPLAIMLIDQKQYEGAEQLLLKALAEDKQQSWRWPFELAFAYAKQGQWDKAMEYGRMAAGRPGAPSKVHLLTADLYSNTGNPGKAIAELELFEKIDAHSSYIPRVQQVLAKLRQLEQSSAGQQKSAPTPSEH